MVLLKGHYDGTTIVLDEPASLTVGQSVRVVVLEGASPDWLTAEAFNPHVDPNPALMTGGEVDERDALHVDPLDQVPSDFVRQPGSGRGEVHLADDFDDPLDLFKDYM